MSKRAMVPPTREVSIEEHLKDQESNSEVSAEAAEWAKKTQTKGRGRPAQEKKKKQISIFFDPEFLDRIDKQAAKMGLTRTALITTGTYNYLAQLEAAS